MKTAGAVRLSIADTDKADSLASRMRRARVAHFFEVVHSTFGRQPVEVLDVGGMEHYWEMSWNERCEGMRITLLNLEPEPLRSSLPIRSLAGDARHMPQFADRQFDICFSNSVIEHVGSLADQKSMADEVRRVAKTYYVQTPYRYFPIEPHFHVPGWAQLPLWLRTWMHQRMDLGWVKKRPDYLDARIAVEQCRLLSIREFRLLFPDGRIHLERLGPLVKSMTATGSH
jgi:hypothetical protein